MVANIRGYTPNYGFKLINFDTPRWHTHEYANWQQLDSMFLQLGTPPVRGEWLNSTLYAVGDRTFDGETGDLYRCLIQHTSAATGTFENDRTAHPTYWTLQILGVPLFRGEWLPLAVYALGDIVTIDGLAYYLCTTSHTSSNTFPPDAAFWQTIFDASNIVLSVDAAEAAATAAAASATAAQEAAEQAEQAASAAASSQSAFRWNYDPDTTVADPGLAEMRFNSATPTSITRLILSAQSADFGNPDVSGWIITWDDSTNLTSRGSIYVRNTQSPENYMILEVNGPVVDHGTWQEVSVIHIANGGSITAGDNLAIAFTRTGNSGTSGSGSGDMQGANNLSDVEDPAEAAENIGVGVTDTPTFAQVHLGVATISDHAITKGTYDTDMALKAPLASPVFTGNPTAPTPTVGDDDNSIATTEFVVDAVAAGIGSIDLTPYAPKASPVFTGNPTGPTPAANDNDTSLATTAFVIGQLSSSNPAMNGTAAPGVALTGARSDHVHPTDTSRAPLASPTFTGDPKAPTPSAGDNDTSIATTAFVTNAVAAVAAPAAATAAEYVGNTAPTKMLTPGAVWTASAATDYGSTSSLTPLFGSHLSLQWTPSSTTCTVNNPTGQKAGQKGTITIKQGGTGGGQVTLWDTHYKFPGGVKPSLTTAANAVDVISYDVLAVGIINCVFVADLK